MFDAVSSHVRRVYVVSVGIFFKRKRVFVQLRPMRRWVQLGVLLPRKADDPRIARKVIDTGRSFYHVLNIAGREEVDETVRAWLDEAYLSDS